MARGMFHKVGGKQSREAEKHGFVQVDRETARRFFESGKTVIVTGSRVPPAHFTKGYKLAIVLEGSMVGCGNPQLLPGVAGSGGGSRSLAVRTRAAPAVRSRDFDGFMVGVDREMQRSPYGPRAVTFVLRSEYPRLDR